MPQYIEVKGQVIEFPDGMSAPDIESAIKRNMMDVPPDGPKVSRTDRFAKGLRDPIDGGAQLLTNLLPKSVVEAGNTANNWLADKTGLVGRLPAGGVDQQVRESEQAYQAQRGDTGVDMYRMLGNVLNPANAAVVSRLPMAATLAGRVGIGALGGASSSALAPVASGDFAEEKAKQVATGAAFGGALPMVTGALARAVSPKASLDPNVQLLKAEGVRPTIGQTLGGNANKLEEKLQSVPFFGDAITKARQSAGADLSKSAANRALFPIGKSLPKDLKGHEAVSYVRKSLGDAYDNVVPKLSVTQDKPFQQSVSSLQSMVRQGAISPNAKNSFDRFLKGEVSPLFQGDAKSMTGETFKRLQSKITERIQQTGASTNADERLLNGAYKDLGDQLNQLSIRTNPKAAAELKAINTGYANFKRMQKAASSVAADDGEFTPAMLHNAVKAADRSKDKRAFSEGAALMQDLSAAGKTVLSNKVADSGTAGRAAMMAGGVASGLVSPLVPIGLAGGYLGGNMLYSQPSQNLLRGLVSSRSQLAQPAANMIRKATPALIPGASQFGLGLLNYEQP
jgi:hypothetical protein